MKNELVSVVVPTYNREGTIVRSVNSVLGQTYRNLECIVVDDGSQDNTKGVISRMNDNRVRYIRLEKNSGPSVARNIGIRESRGNYLAFNDSDDLWLPDKLEMQMEKMACEGAGMVYCSYLYQNNGREYQVPSKRCVSSELEGDIFESLWNDNKIGTPTILVKKNVYQHVENLQKIYIVLKIGNLFYEFPKNIKLHM